MSQSLEIHEAKTDRTEWRNRQFNNNSWKRQYPTFNNGENNWIEEQHGNRTLEQQYKPSRLNRSFSNKPSKNSRTHILLQCNGTFSGIDHMLGHKTSLNKFKM